MRPYMWIDSLPEDERGRTLRNLGKMPVLVKHMDEDNNLEECQCYEVQPPWDWPMSAKVVIRRDSHVTKHVYWLVGQIVPSDSQDWVLPEVGFPGAVCPTRKAALARVFY